MSREVIVFRTCLVSMLFALVGCSTQSSNKAVERIEVQVRENAVPGTVSEPWVEPMVDIVKVPGQLDPTGTYYIPEHSTVVEIRPDRFEDVRFEGEKKK